MLVPKKILRAWKDNLHKRDLQSPWEVSNKRDME